MQELEKELFDLFLTLCPSKQGVIIYSSTILNSPLSCHLFFFASWSKNLGAFSGQLELEKLNPITLNIKLFAFSSFMYIRLYCDISNLLLPDCVYKIRQASRVKTQTDLLIGYSGLGCIIQGNREQKKCNGPNNLSFWIGTEANTGNFLCWNSASSDGTQLSLSHMCVFLAAGDTKSFTFVFWKHLK